MSSFENPSGLTKFAEYSLEVAQQRKPSPIKRSPSPRPLSPIKRSPSPKRPSSLPVPPETPAGPGKVSKPVSPVALPEPAPEAIFPAVLPESKKYNDAILGFQNIDTILMRHGVVRLNNILVRDEKGKEKIAYIKARNIAGDVFYIDVSSPGNATVQTSNSIVVTNFPGKSISPSVMVSALDCAGSAVCGVAFDCQGEYCMARKNDQGKVEMSSYTTIESPQESSALIDNSPLAFPIVKLEDLDKNPDQTTFNIRRTTCRYQEIAIHENGQMLDGMIRNLNKLTESLQALKSAYTKSFNFYSAESSSSYSSLDSYRKKMAEKTPINVEEMAKLKTLSDRLFDLTSLFGNLVSSGGAVGRMSETIYELAEQIAQTRLSMYIRLRTIRESSGSKVPIDPKNWALPSELAKHSLVEITQGRIELPDKEINEALRSLFHP